MSYWWFELLSKTSKKQDSKRIQNCSINAFLAWPGLAWAGLVWPGLDWPGLALANDYCITFFNAYKTLTRFFFSKFFKKFQKVSCDKGLLRTAFLAVKKSSINLTEAYKSSKYCDIEKIKWHSGSIVVFLVPSKVS